MKEEPIAEDPSAIGSVNTQPTGANLSSLPMHGSKNPPDDHHPNFHNAFAIKSIWVSPGTSQRCPGRQPNGQTLRGWTSDCSLIHCTANLRCNHPQGKTVRWHSTWRFRKCHSRKLRRHMPHRCIRLRCSNCNPFRTGHMGKSQRNQQPQHQHLDGVPNHWKHQQPTSTKQSLST